jgi:hypothetical protein
MLRNSNLRSLPKLFVKFGMLGFELRLCEFWLWLLFYGLVVFFLCGVSDCYQGRGVYVHQRGIPSRRPKHRRVYSLAS